MKDLTTEVRLLIASILLRGLQKVLPQGEFRKDLNRFLLFHSHLLIKTK